MVTRNTQPRRVLTVYLPMGVDVLARLHRALEAEFPRLVCGCDLDDDAVLHFFDRSWADVWEAL